MRPLIPLIAMFLSGLALGMAGSTFFWQGSLDRARENTLAALGLVETWQGIASKFENAARTNEATAND